MKRVELGPDYYIVTNYLKSYKFIYTDIESINNISMGRFDLITYRLRGKSSLGKKITFLANKQLYGIFLESYPEIARFLESLTEKQNED